MLSLICIYVALASTLNMLLTLQAMIHVRAGDAPKKPYYKNTRCASTAEPYVHMWAFACKKTMKHPHESYGSWLRVSPAANSVSRQKDHKEPSTVVYNVYICLYIIYTCVYIHIYSLYIYMYIHIHVRDILSGKAWTSWYKSFGESWL